MKADILNPLKPVRNRLRIQATISLLVPGATVGGIAACVLGTSRVVFGVPVELSLLVTIVLGCALLSAIVGYLMKRSWNEAATVVDACYCLKDRTLTALQFSEQPEISVFRQLQLQDAKEHLQSVDAKVVVPFKAPRQWRWAVLSSVVATVLALLPTADNQLLADVNNNDGVLRAANAIEKQIDEIEQIADEANIEELKDLVATLHKDLEELKRPNSEIRESLETISEMQKKMRQLMAELDVNGMDMQLAEVAEAMAGATPFKPTSDALKKQDLKKAAQSLDELDAGKQMDPSESRPTSEKLAEAAESAKKKGQDKLSDALKKLAQKVRSGDKDGMAKESNKVADEIRKHDVRKSVKKMLKNRSDQLSESKQMLSSNSDKSGSGSGKGQNLAKGKSEKKSSNASKKAGAKSAGNVNGQKTQLDSERQMAKLTGKLGSDGESEFETTTSADAQEQSQRMAKEAFAKYQKMSEAVLDSEPIPLGHRRTIRRYFELIRPTTEQTSATEEMNATE